MTAAVPPPTPDGAASGERASSHPAWRTGGGGGVAAAAVLILVGTGLSRVLGMGRELLAADRFGTGDEMAAFSVADNVHTLLFDLAIGGMLQAALIPVLARWAAPDAASRVELRRIAGALLTLVLVVVGVAVLLGIVFAPRLVAGMTALFGEGGARGAEATALTVSLVRWLLPAVLLLGAATTMMAVLHAVGRIAAPALALALRNAAIVAAVLLFGDRLGVRSLALGVVVGAALIVLALVPPLRAAGALPRPNLGWGDPAVREVLRLYAPIFAGLVVGTAAVVVDRSLAWGAGEDALGAMRYATTLVQLVLGLVAAAISLAALPTLARHHAAGDEAAFVATLGRALAMTTILIVPATLGLAAVGVPTVDLLFGRGATDAAGQRAIVVALLGYLPGTLFAAYDQILIFAFYARGDTRTPVLVGLVAVGVYVGVALLLVGRLGMLGLVLANSAQFAAHAVAMWALAGRACGLSATPALRRLVGQCGVAAALCALLALVVWRLLAEGWSGAGSAGGGTGREMALVGLPAGAGAVAYLGALWWWRVEELAVLRRATLGRVLPRFGR